VVAITDAAVPTAALDKNVRLVTRRSDVLIVDLATVRRPLV
jgi:hypothetical protein